MRFEDFVWFMLGFIACAPIVLVVMLISADWDAGRSGDVQAPLILPMPMPM